MLFKIQFSKVVLQDSGKGQWKNGFDFWGSSALVVGFGPGQG